ncbi:Protein QUIRKY [Vitis vinifera]|uniref:Protein QUIRKY n=1 Tax=Vitis vinifera TaxID=29760 RepID=A0A438IIC1_VITVI|nr:Protein QUIRKY [Vitis vinifera]
MATIRKLIVERKRTKTVVRDLNPTWNEVLEFNVASGALELFGDTIEVDVLHDRSYGHTRRNNCLGRIRLSSRQFVKKGEEALIYFPLEKKSFFSWTQGDIGFKIYYVDEEVPSQPPVLEEVKPPEAVPPPAADSGTTDAPAAPPPKTEAVPPAEPEPAASDPPKSSEEQPPAPPPVEAPPAEEPAPPSENPTPEAEKQPESEPPPPPQEGTQDKMEACPPDVEQSNAETEAPVPKWVPSPQVMASIENRSAPQVKFAPFEPVHRPLSSGNFKADLRGTVSIERTSFDLVEKMHYIFVRVVKARSLPTKGNPVVTIAVSGSHVSSKPALKMWDPQRSNPSDVAGDGFLGGICFDVAEIPLRDPPDSPLAPQWYRIEGGAADNGVLMLATWIGTQADESFPEAWITDAAGSVHSKSKVYQSPKLWYLRITVMEAQDVLPLTSLKDLSLQLTVKLGFQIQKTKVSVTRNGTPLWNQDLMFVAAEPFTHEHLIFTLESQQTKGKVATLGVGESAVDVDRAACGRSNTCVALRLPADGETALETTYRTVELGIIACKNLLPMKTIDGRGSTDAYAVAKYGPKWVRTRTVSESLDPKWNEQYTWKVYDPCTVLSVGVFDSSAAFQIEGSKEATHPDFRMGKEKANGGDRAGREIRTCRSHARHPPRLQPTSLALNAPHQTSRSGPTGNSAEHCCQNRGRTLVEVGATAEAGDRALHVGRRHSGLQHAKESDGHNPGARLAGAAGVVPGSHLPTLSFYVFAIGAWNYRFKSREPLPHFCPKISMVEAVDREELDEEFDTVPSSRSPERVLARYDKLRTLGARVQTVLGDAATPRERVQALVMWRDPRATGIFVGMCLVVAVVLYLVPSKMVAMAGGFYYMRHPMFRDRAPSPAFNFFRRLPSLSDRMM